MVIVKNRSFLEQRQYNNPLKAVQFNASALTSPSTLDIWLRGDSFLSLDSTGGQISIPQWGDKSGNGYLVTQSTKTAQPTRDTLNGLPALRFSAGQQWLLTNYTKPLQDFTLFIAYQQLAYGSTNFHRIADKAYDTGFFLATNSTGTNTITFDILGNYSEYAQIDDSIPHVLTAQRSGSIISLYDKKNQLFSKTRPTTQLSNAPLIIGYSNYALTVSGGYPPNINNMLLAELILYSSALSSTTLATAQNQLIQRYRL